MTDKFALVYSWFIRTIMFFFPDSPLIMRLRGKLYSLFMKNSGKNFQVSSNTVLLGLTRISVGNDVYFANGVIVAARAEIDIDDEVLVGFNSVIVSGNHTKNENSGSYRFGASDVKPIRIGKGVWIASNSTITAGTKINSGAFIGPTCVASGTYNENSVNLCDKAKPRNIG